MNANDLYSQRPSGLFVLKVFRKGELVDYIEEQNLIVDNSKTIHARLLGGDVTNRSVAKIGVGTSGAAAAAGNTTLTSPFTKALTNVTYPAINKVSFAFSLASGDANGVAIMEWGLLTGADALYARKVRSVPLNKASDITVTGVWTITFP